MDGNGDNGSRGSNGSLPPWLNVTKNIVAVIVSVLAVLATILSTRNSSRISAIEHVSEVNKTFADALHEARDVLSSPKEPTAAMIEAAQIYSLAETPARKLVLVDIVSKANQNQAIGALATLIRVDDDIQHPSERDRPVANEIVALIDSQITTIANAPVPPATAKPPEPGVTPSAAPTSGGDVTLTSGSSPVAARARLAAALPVIQETQGWVFIGDADTDVSQPGQPLHEKTMLTDADKVPSKGDSLVACTDLNIREHTFVDGQLGSLVAIVRAGTTINVTGPPKSIAGKSPVDGRPISAIWVPVSVKPNPTIANVGQKCTKQ
jgi:hypothetical protein